jgi:hypothetical protein
VCSGRHCGAPPVNSPAAAAKAMVTYHSIRLLRLKSSQVTHFFLATAQLRPIPGESPRLGSIRDELGFTQSPWDG